MILYHGTSSKHLEAIQRSGLRSRRKSKRRSNWKGHLESKPDFVYLTDAYPVYYAMNPALYDGESEAGILVVKVDVDKCDLYPDEDFIAGELARGGVGRPVAELIAEIDPADYRHHWRQSLERNGTVCTPAVPAERILDYRIIDRANHRLLMAIGGDAMPVPINYQFMGQHYGRCIEGLFEHGEEAAMRVAASYWRLGEAS